MRVPLVYGPRDRQRRVAEYLQPMEAGQREIGLTEFKASWRWRRGYVVDMAYAITLGVIDERAAGKVYNVGEQEALSTKEWVEAIGKAAGWEGEVVIIPDEVQPDGQQNNLNFKQDLVVDTSRIRHELGYAELIPRKEALRRSVAWERTNPPETIDW